MATLAVIPCLNEGPRIAPLVQELRGLHPAMDILVVDDGSEDDSAAQAASAGARVLSHRLNRGYGSALYSGYCYALKQGFQRVVQLDGDGQHLPSEVAPLLEAIDRGSCDLVVGSRFLGPAVYPMPMHHRTGIAVFGLLLRGLTGYPFTDPTSGFQAMGRRVLEEFTRFPFPSDYPDADVLLRLHRRGLRIREVPVVMRQALGGRSMHSGLRPLRYAATMPGRLAQAWWSTRRDPGARRLPGVAEPRF